MQCRLFGYLCTSTGNLDWVRLSFALAPVRFRVGRAPLAQPHSAAGPSPPPAPVRGAFGCRRARGPTRHSACAFTRQQWQRPRPPARRPGPRVLLRVFLGGAAAAARTPGRARGASLRADSGHPPTCHAGRGEAGLRQVPSPGAVACPQPDLCRSPGLPPGPVLRATAVDRQPARPLSAPQPRSGAGASSPALSAASLRRGPITGGGRCSQAECRGWRGAGGQPPGRLPSAVPASLGQSRVSVDWRRGRRCPETSSPAPERLERGAWGRGTTHRIACLSRELQVQGSNPTAATRGDGSGW